MICRGVQRLSAVRKRRLTFLRDIQDGFPEKVRNEALKYM